MCESYKNSVGHTCHFTTMTGNSKMTHQSEIGMNVISTIYNDTANLWRRKSTLDSERG